MIFVLNIYNICDVNLYFNYVIIVICCIRVEVYMVDFINIFDVLVKYIVMCLNLY